jgi:hypothetical protein
VPAEQKIKARRQRRDQGRLEAEYGIQFGQVPNDAALVSASYKERLLVRYQASSQLGGARSNFSQSSVEAANTQPKRLQTRLLVAGRDIANTSLALAVRSEGMKQLRTLCAVGNRLAFHGSEEEHVRSEIVGFVDDHFACAERRRGKEEVD